MVPHHPKTTLVATLIFVPRCCSSLSSEASSCLISTKVRLDARDHAYTVSFEEAGKPSPQIRNILMKYPMVTDVGSELGRPDDGTDPTGFFNDEFYVGLKPYDDASWKRAQDP